MRGWGLICLRKLRVEVGEKVADNFETLLGDLFGLVSAHEGWEFKNLLHWWLGLVGRDGEAVNVMRLEGETDLVIEMSASAL